VNHVGFIVNNVQERAAQWKAAGVAVLAGTNNRLDQAFVVTPDGVRMEILEDKAQSVPIRGDFVYFRTVQEGWPWTNGLQNVVGFDGRRGLYEDLATGNVPSLAFIAPNQCNDQHGRGNGDAFCAFDFGADTSGLTHGTQVGLNPGLIQQGDVTLERLVTSIKASAVWREGRTAIVIVWDGTR
jgi:hypothetical protein